jgi:hypothetical protein
VLTVDRRSRFHLVGLAVGALAAIWAAFQGDWWFALLFAVGTLFTGAGVLHRIRQARDL